MAHRVHHRQVQHVTDQTVVEGVTSHLVGGLQDRAGGDVTGADRARRHEGPHQFCLQAHRTAAHRSDEDVAVGAFRDDDERDERGQRPAPVEKVIGEDRGGHLEHADPLDTVDQRDPSHRR